MHMTATLKRICAEIQGYTGNDALAVWDILLGSQEAESITGDLYEIGVSSGRTAAALSLYLRGNEKLVLVDYPGGRREQVLGTVAECTGTLPDSIQWHSVDSRRFWRRIVAEHYGSARFFHIDGEHSEEAVTNDLDLAHAILSPDGILSVDDFFNLRYIQVSQAVFRYIDRHPSRFRLFLCGYDKAMLCRPSRLRRNLEFVNDVMSDEMRARGMPCTLYKTTYSAELDCYGIQKEREVPFFGPDWAKSDRSVYL